MSLYLQTSAQFAAFDLRPRRPAQVLFAALFFAPAVLGDAARMRAIADRFFAEVLRHLCATLAKLVNIIQHLIFKIIF